MHYPLFLNLCSRDAVVIALFFMVAGYAVTIHAAPATPDTIPVVIQTVDVDEISGQLISLSISSGATILIDGKEKSIPVSNLVRISTRVKPLTGAQRDTVLTLTGGDVLQGRILEGDHENVMIETRDLGILTLPLDALARMDMAQAFSPAFRKSARWLTRSPRVGEDRILFTNGDVLHGIITSLDAQALSIEGDMGESHIPVRVIVSVRFASPAASKSPQVYFMATLQSTGRVTLSELEWTGRKMRAKLHQGPSVQIDPKYIVRLDVQGGRWNWLTAFEPVHYEYTPMGSVKWPFVKHQNVLGESMVVAGQTYEQGVGVHSRSSLVYDLKGQFQQFVTSFGMDDHSGPFADVAVRILIDGNEKYQKEHIRRGKLHGPVRLDVHRALKIELIVDFGDNGDLQDRFNWIHAALIR